MQVLDNMVERQDLEDWAWQLAADVYRLNLYSQLTKQWPPRNGTVTDEELAGAIRDSFTQVHEAAYREMVKLASDAALEVYDRVLSRTVKQSRVAFLIDRETSGVLRRQPYLVGIEACASSHHWSREFKRWAIRCARYF